MRIPVTLTAIALALGVVAAANSQVYKPTAGGGSSSITAGTTATSGCGANGVMFSQSSLVQCDTGFTYAGAGGQVALTGSIAVPNGAAGTPSFVLGNSGSTTGIFGSNTTFIIGTSGVAQATITSNSLALASANSTSWGGDTFLSRSAANTLRIGATAGTATGSLALTNLTASGTLAATLTTATGANVVCNAGTASSLLTLQVSATGCAASARRFKEVISSIDLDRAFETVMGMRPVSFFYNKEYADDPEKHIGFIAEEVNELPSPVAGYSMTTTEKDSELLHGVKYNEMPALFAAAFQKIVTKSEERFAQLKADNDNLRAEVEDLKRRVH